MRRDERSVEAGVRGLDQIQDARVAHAEPCSGRRHGTGRLDAFEPSDLARPDATDLSMTSRRRIAELDGI
ncbi:MAG: hypothetical protein ACK4MF_03670 [Hyphomicrobiaceae bacterium]